MKISQLIKIRKKEIGIFVFFLISVSIYFFFDPSKNSYFLKCPLKEMTGYECAGCGVQRAFHSFLHFRVLEAFKFNPLFVIAIPIIVFLLLNKCFNPNYEKTIFSKLFFRKSFFIVLLIIVLLFSLFRNTVFYNGIIENL